MKHAIKRLAAPAWIIGTLLLTGCATMSEAEREAREYERVEFRHQFIVDRDRCNAVGGQIYFQAPGGTVDRHGIPRTRVWYECVRTEG